MSGPGYHGRTHAPGGTDPIPGLAGSGLPVGFAQADQRSQTLTGGGAILLAFKFFNWNDDDVFGYADVVSGTPKRARYLTIKQSGVYMVKALANWNTAFTSGDHPYIQTTVWLPSTSTQDTLINTAGVDSFVEEYQPMITNEQITTDEMAHQGLHSTSIFSTDLWGETEVGIGVGVGADVSRTKTWDGYLVVVRLGDATTEQTIT